ncbi:hypothetical protein B0H13DRAFT_1890376 [Mycena leptocephala]|nr:hypothetical protein B0H13DRAFT_1890376 [Mycena leptocephala]
MAPSRIGRGILSPTAALIHRADPLYRRKGTPSCWDAETCQDHATNQASAGAVPVVMLTRVQVVCAPSRTGGDVAACRQQQRLSSCGGIGSAPPIYGSFPLALRLRWKDNGRVAFLTDSIPATIPSAKRPCTPPEVATPPAEEEKAQPNANYTASSSTATTTTTTCLLMGERERGRRWRNSATAMRGSSSPVILRLPPAHDPLLLLPLDLRRAWSMPRSGQARVGAAIAYPALGRHMSRTRGDGGRRTNNGGFAALRPRPALRTSSHTQRVQPLAQAQFKITAQRLEGYPQQRTMLLLHDSWRARARLWRGTSRHTGVLETLRIPDQHAPSDTARRWASPATRTSGARYAVMCEFPCPLLSPFSAGSFLSVSRTGVLVSARTRRRATFVLVSLRGAPDYKQRHHFAPA